MAGEWLTGTGGTNVGTLLELLLMVLAGVWAGGVVDDAENGSYRPGMVIRID